MLILLKADNSFDFLSLFMLVLCGVFFCSYDTPSNEELIND